MVRIFQQTLSLQDSESPEDQSGEQSNQVTTSPQSPLTKASSDKSDNPSDSAFNDSFLEAPSPPGPSPPRLSESASVSESRSPPAQQREQPRPLGPLPPSPPTHSQPPPYPTPPPKPRPSPKPAPADSESEAGSVVALLESVHRLNCLLESKEEEVVTLATTLRMVTCNQDTAAPAPDQVLSCLDTEVARYRDLNARLLAEIQENKGQLAELGRTTDTRRKMVTQLEFDVNVIERESKRLQVEIVLSPNCSPGHNFGQQMTRSTLNFWTLLI